MMREKENEMEDDEEMMEENDTAVERDYITPNQDFNRMLEKLICQFK